MRTAGFAHPRQVDDGHSAAYYRVGCVSDDANNLDSGVSGAGEVYGTFHNGCRHLRTSRSGGRRMIARVV